MKETTSQVTRSHIIRQPTPFDGRLDIVPQDLAARLRADFRLWAVVDHSGQCIFVSPLRSAALDRCRSGRRQHKNLLDHPARSDFFVVRLGVVL